MTTNLHEMTERCMNRIETEGNFSTQIYNILQEAIANERQRAATIALEFGIPTVSTKTIAQRILTGWSANEKVGE